MRSAHLPVIAMHVRDDKGEPNHLAASPLQHKIAQAYPAAMKPIANPLPLGVRWPIAPAPH